MYILTAGTQLGRFQLVHMLGKGGMGEVWKATDPRLGRDVAIKILPPDMAKDPDLKTRFERESKILAALNNPFIAQIYEAGEEKPHHAVLSPGQGPISFLVMELIQGKSLSELLQDGPLPVLTVVKLGRQIARALAAAHRAGIIHRDLKPANIMVTGKNQAKVLDFGLARPYDRPQGGTAFLPEVTMPGVVMGTAAYLSPEQVKGNPADVRTDIWAIGCVLYQMLSGKRAFDSNSVPEILAGILRDDPEDLQTLNAEVSPELATLIQKCMEKNPERRPRTALEVATLLRKIGHDLRSGANDLRMEEEHPPCAVINIENVNRYLKMIDTQFATMTLKKSGPAFVEVLHRGVKIGIIAARNNGSGSDLLLFVSPVMKLPAANLDLFYKRLLVLSNGHTDIAQFAIDRQTGFVNLTCIRLCENLDFKEFQYTLDAIGRVVSKIGFPLKAEFEIA